VACLDVYLSSQVRLEVINYPWTYEAILTVIWRSSSRNTYTVAFSDKIYAFRSFSDYNSRRLSLFFYSLTANELHCRPILPTNAHKLIGYIDCPNRWISLSESKALASMESFCTTIIASVDFDDYYACNTSLIPFWVTSDMRHN